jgi:hypothetical protein
VPREPAGKAATEKRAAFARAWSRVERGYVELAHRLEVSAEAQFDEKLRARKRAGRGSTAPFETRSSPAHRVGCDPVGRSSSPRRLSVIHFDRKGTRFSGSLGMTQGEATAVENYLAYVLDAKGGQKINRQQ